MSDEGASLRKLWGEDVPSQRIDAVWAGVSARRRTAKTRGSRPAFIVAAAAIGAVVLGFILMPRRSDRGDPGPLRLATGAMMSGAFFPDLNDGETVLDDGSRIVISTPTELVPLENDGRRFKLRLARGHAVFNVVPGGPRQWMIDAGTVNVIVIGTKFSVDRDDARVSVRVEHGIVRVVGERLAGGEQRLHAGESVEIAVGLEQAPLPTSIPPSPPDVASPPRGSPTEARAVSGAPSEELSEPSALASARRAVEAPFSSPRVRGAPWRPLAKEGKYTQAFEALGQRGTRSETVLHDSPEDLIAIADVARLSGHPGDAVAPLERVLREHPTSPLASTAAFTLGKIEADQLDDPTRAAEAFEQALGIGLPTSLAEEAWARVAESRRKQGDLARASKAARRYLTTYPGGRHERAMKRWIADSP